MSSVVNNVSLNYMFSPSIDRLSTPYAYHAKLEVLSGTRPEDRKNNRSIFGTGEVSLWVRSVQIEPARSARLVESWYVAGALGHVEACKVRMCGQKGESGDLVSEVRAGPARVTNPVYVIYLHPIVEKPAFIHPARTSIGC